MHVSKPPCWRLVAIDQDGLPWIAGGIFTWRKGMNRDGPEPIRRRTVDRQAFEREVRRWD
jgi:hypothetical protein